MSPEHMGTGEYDTTDEMAMRTFASTVLNELLYVILG